MTSDEGRQGDQAEWVFGDFRLLPQAGVLLHGDRVVRIGSRAYELLKILVEHAGEVVSREELMARVWPSTTVGEDNLKVHLSALRRLLGGEQGGVQILAVPGRGYRFIGVVTPGAAPLAQSRLPRVTTRLFGREDSLAATVARLQTERLVTIVGAAGIGKTTLATAAARADGGEPVFVDLSGLSDGEALPAHLAGVLGFPVTSSDARSALVNHFRKHPTLVVLDNCEHLIEATAALVADLLAETDRLRVMATSREPLRLPGEWVFRLTPLGVPPGPLQDARDAARYPAIELFVDRVTAQADGFQFVDHDWPAVAEICRRLDGIPLAIELAAAAMPSMGVANLIANLQQSLDAAVGLRGAPDRQATLRAALDWSYRLLSEGERRMLRRLAVFGGTFTLAAALEVAGGQEVGPEPLKVFVALADKSLVNVHMSGREVRYRLLQMTRDFGLAEMDAEEARAARRRHAQHQLKRLAEAESAHGYDGHGAGAARYAPMIDDLRAALDWAVGPQGDVALAARLIVDSVVAWYQLSLSWEGHQRADKVLARIAELGDPRVELQVRGARCIGMNYSLGAAPPTAAAFAELLAQAEALQDPAYVFMGQWGLFGSDMYMGRFQACMRRAEICGELARRSGRPDERALSTFMRILPAASVGRLRAARDDAELALRLYEAPGGTGGIVRFQFEPRMAVRAVRSRILWIQGLGDQAMAEALACLAEAERAGHALSRAYALLDGTAQVALLIGDVEEADRAVQAHRRLTDDFGLGARTLAMNFGMQAAVHAARTSGEDARDMLLDALKEHPENRFPLRFPFLIGPMAQALAEGGRPRDALGALETTLAGLARDPDHWCRPELLRARAQVRLRLGGAAAREVAEADLDAALAMTRVQGSRAVALRVATDLTLLAPAHGRPGRTACLNAIVQTFDEGFSTADYRRALEVLGPAPAPAPA
jgi:predicted ATPase/DNA-binding winged helix-turn-helix (wHTH) protein